MDYLLNELEKREHRRNTLRKLRDASNPFHLPDEVFRQMYRLNSEAAYDLFQEFLPFLIIGERTTKTPTLIRYFIALHFLAHGSYQKSIGADHLNGSSQPNVSRSIHEVVNAVVLHLAPRYVRFPQLAAEIAHVKDGFFRKFHIPGIIGCIDCTHIKIVPPSFINLGYPAHVFVNRKNYHSINTQVICDVNLRILAVNARFPGSVHDAAIWRMSNARILLHRNFIQGHQATYLIGDSGYPLLPYLLTPIVNAPPNTAESRYTERHRQIRNCIERMNGLLKGVWRCLHSDRVQHYKPDFVSKIIYASCILHNVVRGRNIPVDHLLVEDDNWNEEIDNNEFDDAQLLNRGHLVRNRIINTFFQ